MLPKASRFLFPFPVPCLKKRMGGKGYAFAATRP
jgi:hypothetical protein